MAENPHHYSTKSNPTDRYQNHQNTHQNPQNKPQPPQNSHPSNGFDIYINNLQNQLIEVECNDQQMSSYQGKLIAKKWDFDQRVFYIQIQILTESEIVRVDYRDIAFIRALDEEEELDFNPIHESAKGLSSEKKGGFSGFDAGSKRSSEGTRIKSVNIADVVK